MVLNFVLEELWIPFAKATLFIRGREPLICPWWTVLTLETVRKIVTTEAVTDIEFGLRRN